MTPGRPRRVLILNWRDLRHPEGGGGERYVEQVARGLVAGGDDVTIHCAAYPGAARRETIAGVGYRRAGGRLTVYPRGIMAVLRLRPDVVVDVQNGVPFFSVLVHSRVVRLVHHISRDQWFGAFPRVVARVGWWLESRVVPRLYRAAPAVGVSSATRDDLVRMGADPRRTAVVYNATEPAPVWPADQRPAPPDPTTLCVVARLVPHKQVDHAVEVLARLASEHPGLRLRVIGDGPAAGELAAHAARLGVADRVDLLGFVDEAAKHRAIASSWLLLCPSGKEGWGRVVMEAAVHGVPAIAYRRAGGLGEAIVDGETGLLADNVEELAAHTRRLLDDPVERDRLGRRAADRAAEFTEERTVADFRRALAGAASPLLRSAR